MRKNWWMITVLTATQMATFAMAANFKVSIGIRETGVGDFGIGGNGGTGSSAIEWVNKDGLTLSDDGDWHTFTWNFGTDPVVTFAGTQPVGGAVNRLDGNWGVFEHLRILNASGTPKPLALYVDDLTNTPANSSPVIFENFDSFPAAANPSATAPEVVFRDPKFSPTTSLFIVSGDTGNVSAADSYSGPNSYRLGWSFIDLSTSNWVRLTTFGTANRPNPAIDIQPGSTFSLKLKMVVLPEPTSSVSLAAFFLIARRRRTR